MSSRALTLLLACLPLCALAHGGRTDKNGCHMQTATGIRHCHGHPHSHATATVPAYNRPTHQTHEVAPAPSNGRPNYLEVQSGWVAPGLAKVQVVQEAPTIYAPNPVYVAPVAIVPKPVVVVPVKKGRTHAAPRDLGDEFYFETCYQAQQAGHLPLRRGDSGYRAELDPDGDGVACL